jgi:hypothetical protein
LLKTRRLIAPPQARSREIRLRSRFRVIAFYAQAAALVVTAGERVKKRGYFITKKQTRQIARADFLFSFAIILIMAL